MSPDHDPTDLQAEEDAQAQAASKAQARAEQDRADIRQLMSTAQGRRIVWRLLGQAGVFRTAFSSDALMMARTEGRREYGLWMLDEIMTHASQHWLEMYEEGQANE